MVSPNASPGRNSRIDEFNFEHKKEDRKNKLRSPRLWNVMLGDPDHNEIVCSWSHDTKGNLQAPRDHESFRTYSSVNLWSIMILCSLLEHQITRAVD